jgi:hypothetical protein
MVECPQKHGIAGTFSCLWSDSRPSGERAQAGSAVAAKPRVPGRRVLLALFCACMVLFAATVRVAHSHPATEQDSGHCQICIAIHTAMPAVSAPVHIVLHAAPEPVATPAPKALAKVRVEALSDRAPPAIA